MANLRLIFDHVYISSPLYLESMHMLDTSFFSNVAEVLCLAHACRNIPDIYIYAVYEFRGIMCNCNTDSYLMTVESKRDTVVYTLP